MRSLTDIKSIYWIAGILEGEGYFGMKDSPVIILKMNDRDTVVRAAKILKPDCTIYTTEHENIKHNTSYNINVVGNIAIEWMFTLYPLMSLRRKTKIRSIIEEWKSRAVQPKVSNKCRKGHRLEIYGTDFTIEASKQGTPIRRCRLCKIQAQKRYRRRAS